VGDEELPKLG